MLKLRTPCVAAAALMLALVMCASPAMAAGSFTASEGMGAVTFRGTGAAAYYYNITVEHPYAIGLDADYWNMTVYADPWDGGVATNTTYTVNVYIDDGLGHNITEAATLVAKNDKRVYDNISFEAADWAALEENVSATITVDVAGVWTWCGPMQIWENDLTAVIMNVMLLVLPMIVLLMFLGMIMKAMDPVRKRRK
jgi:hypothetical protein